MKLTSNLSETAEFVENLPGNHPETLVRIHEFNPIVAKTYQPGSGTQIQADLDPHQGEWNYYFHVNVLKSDAVNRKARKADITEIRMLHVDIDDLGGLDRIRSFPVAPTVVIFSGGGYQAFWFLNEPLLDIARGESANKRIARMLGGDNCGNADRLMRLPGTLNVPNTKKKAKGRKLALAYLVRDETDYSRRYSIEEVENALGEDPSPSTPSGADRALTAPPPLQTVETLDVSISDQTAALIRDGDNPDAGYKSRSEVVFRVACDLARAGASDDIIAGILLNPVNSISVSVLEKRKPLAYAFRQARNAIKAVGSGWDRVAKSGLPVASFPNALLALSRLGLAFEYDAFRNRYRVSGVDVQDFTSELTDDVCAAIRRMVLEVWKFDPGKDHVRDASQTLCLENTVHPICEYLASLTWDGKPRISNWLTDYFAAEPTPFHAAVGELVLVAAARRVRHPGAKFDCILVLEGEQGTGKSTAISILAGDEYFSDQEILTLDAKAQMEAVEGIWLYELGELQGLNRAETDKVKAFASRRVDRGRPAYARFREDRRRQVIFIGTTNDEQYLKDTTGNRRFWPVRTGVINLDLLRRDRDQLWAEAAHVEARGGSLVLAENLWPAAGEAQGARLLDDPWLEALVELKGDVEGNVETVTSARALGALGLLPERQNQFHAKRLVPLLRRLGWTGPKNLRVNGKVVRGYERPYDGSPRIDRSAF